MSDDEHQLEILKSRQKVQRTEALVDATNQELADAVNALGESSANITSSQERLAKTARLIDADRKLPRRRSRRRRS